MDRDRSQSAFRTIALGVPPVALVAACGGGAQRLSGTGNTTHPNFYEEEVSLGPSFGDSVADGVLGLAGEPPRYVLP